MNSRFFGNDPEKVPAKALSVGIGTVTDSKEVLILINGHNKARALAACVEGGVSRSGYAPLQMHPNAIIACDEPACGRKLTVDTYSISWTSRGREAVNSKGVGSREQAAGVKSAASARRSSACSSCCLSGAGSV